MHFKEKNINCAETYSFPNLVLSRGGENLQAGGSLSHQKPSETLVAKNGGKRREAGGRARKRSKSLCSSFWKRTPVEPRTTPDSLQRARHYSLTSHSPCLAIQREWPNLLWLLLHRPHSLTFINLVEIPKDPLVPPSLFQGFRVCTDF